MFKKFIVSSIVAALIPRAIRMFQNRGQSSKA